MMIIPTILLSFTLSCVFADDYSQGEDEFYFAPRENYPSYPYPYHASPYERPVETYAGYQERPFQQRMLPSFWPPFRLWRKPSVTHPETIPEQPVPVPVPVPVTERPVSVPVPERLVPVYEQKPKKTKKSKRLKQENNREASKQKIQPQPVHSQPWNPNNTNAQPEKPAQCKQVCRCEF